jgi:hypothetical protein
MNGGNSMKRIGLFLTLGLLGSVLVGQKPVFAAQHEHSEKHSRAHVERGGVGELRTAMRKLWEDHITYTRNYIISAVADLGDKDAVAKRLLQNQEDIGNAVKPYYGDDAGNKLAALLRDHILIATKVVDTAKADNKQELDPQQKKWSQNGKDIAAFLSGANPNWSKSELEQMLQKHLDLTTGEVVGRLKKDWESDIKSYDEGHAHMLMFADMLTDGIAKQYPDKFRGRLSAQIGN